jgi:hypothetical protein
MFCNPGLERTRELAERLGSPEKSLKFIHVAGTNGKGSTSSMLASVLGHSGLRVGLYTSPYIYRFNERIRVGTELISDPDLFILDEPDSGLDGVIARELFEKLRMVADEGKIVIAITHTPDRVIELFDKVIVLAKDSGKVGRLAFYGSPKQARTFFGKKTMEEIVMAVNSEEEGGEGRADEFIEKYAMMTTTKGAADHE